MSELDEQVRVYLDAASSPVTAAEVIDTEQDAEIDASRGSHRGAMVAAAVLVVAAGLVALLFLSGADDLTGDRNPVIAPVPPQPTVDDVAEPDGTLPEPSSTVEVEQPAVEVETPAMGEVVWTRLDSDEAGGIPSVQRDLDGYVLSGLGDGLLFSSDGREWTGEPLSPELVGYRRFWSEGRWAIAGDTRWWSAEAASNDLLRSNGSQWVNVDLPGDQRGPTGMPLTSASTTLVPGAGDEYWVATDDEAFTSATGEWTWPDEIADPMRGVQIVEAPDGGFIALQTAWGVHPLDEDLPDDRRDSSFLRYANVWASIDGLNWVDRGTPPHLAAIINADHQLGQPARFWASDIRATGGALTMEVTEDSWLEGRTETEYVSTDGVVWAVTEPGSARDPSAPAAARPGSIETGIADADFGYADFDLWSDIDDPRVRIWISRDGSEWREIDVPPEVNDDSLGFIGGGSIGAAGQLVYVGVAADDSVIWIGHLE